jgi:membrane protein
MPSLIAALHATPLTAAHRQRHEEHHEHDGYRNDDYHDLPSLRLQSGSATRRSCRLPPSLPEEGCPGAAGRERLRTNPQLASPTRRGQFDRYVSLVRRAWRVAKRSVVSFYDDQGTHHAAALTYYALMSLFPTLLLAVSLLGLLGEFPATYNAIIRDLRRVVPAVTLAPLDAAVRAALRSKGTAAAGLVIAILTALYGATGYLEAARRALNVVFEASRGRSFVRRKVIDVASTFVLMTLVLTTLVLMFAGGRVARDVLGGEAASVWRLVRWPGAFASALLAFSYIYYITPDVRQRGFRWITPGALTGVTLWLAASAAFSDYLANFKSFNVTYGSFAAAIILLVWLWLTNSALLFGAEVNAETERAQEIAEGVPEPDTLNLPPAD